MARKKGKKTEDTWNVTQEVVRTGVVGESFDFVWRFTNTIDQPELFMDELVKMTLEGLLERYGTIIVKVNWWADGLTVIAPKDIPSNAPQGTQEPSGSTEGSNPSPDMDLEK